jgi:Bacteriophage baseplate protein W
MVMNSKATPGVQRVVRSNPTAAAAGAARAGASTSAGNAMESFLGTGWSFLLELGTLGEAALVSDEDDIRQAIQIILATAPGERVMRPDFGSGLNALVFEPLNMTTIELVRTRVSEALAQWEPRITVLDVNVSLGPDIGSTYFGVMSNKAAAPSGQPGPSALLLIEIVYLIRASNTASNMVYPFYLLEGQPS